MQQNDFRLAEQIVQEALRSDVDFGPAHNTLGRIYFQTNRYYLAAWEFEYAMRLMPERIEPLNNLGMVFEAVGQYDQAVSYYEQAMAVSPDTPQILGNLIRTRLARGDKPFELKREIEHLILIDDRPQWVQWAKIQLLTDDTEAKLMREMNDELERATEEQAENESTVYSERFSDQGYEELLVDPNTIDPYNVPAPYHAPNETLEAIPFEGSSIRNQ